ncbi:MAG: tol-pal system-associated acyl-CoA thioesterase [Alphaproteobacteria bacterium]|nr:tol-pal system-associated acyl-CoA thioesterase [Alphaproteobacteria bacterium]
MSQSDSAAEHVLPLRVYYEDTDAVGVVYHANYLRYAERARTEYLRTLGFEHGALKQADGVAFAVRRAVVDYQRPARLDDALEVRTRLTGLGGATLTAEQRILRQDEILVRLYILLALIGGDGRAIRLPAALRAALKRVMAQPRADELDSDNYYGLTRNGVGHRGTSGARGRRSG